MMIKDVDNDDRFDSQKVLKCLVKDTWTISDQTDVILLNENRQILSL